MAISSFVFAEEGFDPFSSNRGSEFEYSQDDIPKICFFPTDKARWDGYKITWKNWDQLTDFQKGMFIDEGFHEIARKTNTPFVEDYVIPEWQLFLNDAAYEMQELDAKEIPMIKFLYRPSKGKEPSGVIMAPHYNEEVSEVMDSARALKEK